MSKVTAHSIREVLLSLGWESDRWGHMQKDVKLRKRSDPTCVVTRRYRIKLQDRSCRVEVQGEKQSDGVTPWIRVGGGYFKDCAHLPDGRLRLGGTLLGKPAQAQG